VFGVVVSAPVDCEPETAFAPLHASDAVQLVAFVDDHVSVEAAPYATEVGLAERVTVGRFRILHTAVTPPFDPAQFQLFDAVVSA